MSPHKLRTEKRKRKPTKPTAITMGRVREANYSSSSPSSSSGRNYWGLFFCLLFVMAFSGFRRAHCGRFPIARCHNIRIFACNCISITNCCQRFGAEHERPTDPECSISACERWLRVCECLCDCVCCWLSIKMHRCITLPTHPQCACVCTPSCLSKLAFNDVDARSASGNIAAYNYGHSNNNNA